MITAGDSMTLRSASEFPLQRCPEPRCCPDVGQALLEPLPLQLDHADRPRPDVIAKPENDLAVLALCPASDDSAVPPDRRPDVPGVTEQRSCMITEMPVAL